MSSAYRLRQPWDADLHLALASFLRKQSKNSVYRLTISIPLDLWLEGFNLRSDDYPTAQTHRLSFSPKGHIKLVIKVDVKL